MCINITASIGAAIVNAACSAYLFKRNLVGDRFLALTLGYIGTMQWLEVAMHADPDCGSLNRNATRLAQWQNALQPLVFVLCARYILKDTFQDYMFIPFLFCAYLVLPTMLNNPSGCAKPCQTGQMGLAWDYTKGVGVLWVVFALALSVPMLAIPGPRGRGFCALNLFIYLIALVISRQRCGEDKSEVSAGSLWCLMGAVLPIVAIAWRPDANKV